jgi:hypothetical protein
MIVWNSMIQFLIFEMRIRVQTRMHSLASSMRRCNRGKQPGAQFSSGPSPSTLCMRSEGES